MGNDDLGPSWLKPILRANYFNPCSIHGDSHKSECNMFCLDCMGIALCSYSLINHKDHHIVQVSFFFFFLLSPLNIESDCKILYGSSSRDDSCA